MSAQATLHSGHVFVDGEDLTYDALNDMLDLGYGVLESDALDTVETLARGSIIVGTAGGTGTIIAKASGDILIGDGDDLTTVNLATAGSILVGDGTTANKQSMYGDATMDASGQVTVQNQLTIDPEWHTDDTNFPEKTTATGEDVILVEDSQDSWMKKKMSVATFGANYPRYFKHNLVVKNDTSVPNTIMDITVSEIVLTDSSDRRVLLKDIDVSVNMTNSGKNGLDVGAMAASTMYYFYLIYAPATYDDDGVLLTAAETAGLASMSAASPTLPSGFSYKRLVGETYSDGSTYLESTYRTNDYVRFKARRDVYSSLTASFVAKSLPVHAPSGITKLHLQLFASNGYSLVQTLRASADGYDTTVTAYPIVAVTDLGGQTAVVCEVAHLGGDSFYAQGYGSAASYGAQGCMMIGYELSR